MYYLKIIGQKDLKIKDQKDFVAFVLGIREMGQLKMVRMKDKDLEGCS